MQSNKKIHFEVSERKILLRVFDVLSVLFFLYLISQVFDFEYFNISKRNFYWTIVLGLYLNVIGTVFEMYNLQVASNQFQVIKSIILTASTTVLIYLLTPILTPTLPSNRLQIIYFYLAVLIALFLWRLFYVKFLASDRFVKKVILICDKEQLEELVLGLENADPHYKIVGYINSDVSNEKMKSEKSFVENIKIDNLEDFVKENSVSEVVIASQKTDGITVNLYNQLIHLLENGFIIREYTQVYESITQRIPVQYVARDFYRYFPFSRSNQNRLYLLGVRIFEIIISLIGLSVGLLILPLILLGNLLGNRGKLFYTQKRVGKNGKVFKILKFRTMIKNAEKNGAVFSKKNDARITAFGKFLRKSRLDEFPQFINILKGDMAVIGPRPERPVFVREIAEIMPFYETRHVIKPGLTGWAQVNYSYGATIDDSLIKLQYDLYYIKHRSIFIDINIIVKTLSTVVFYRGQ
ncbi:MAG: exopolysaccharide biosynthesis polyprenyl glycosylphosphotransferase [Flavobacterium sp.]|uniref:exopolysaccharide biosynthesis polyprenyl glycosylphosphotransferase n=1 Tax=Flavobacterium sp. TaxID=239 RepID=UPI0022C9B06D|nr:exopolysaccharide biosynthesis polyprenyl glycosylphosphotransferase [Flavobacterium sp.]MCZ8197280.1 exopolysaccharide biosynthesis polyprenyl glycosylphosphotransferase [Flavobacterium sp.]